ncbi:MAG: YqgE/AlgH family protein, partial [Betaproteobacteria bacterium]|nr:YqgE/AlgH family protein [Betaproteobacteria bacterium]
MPSMADPHFSRTLTYICEHSDTGAMGIVVNRPTDLTLSTLLERIGLPLESQEVGRSPVYFGGPVQTNHGFVLHKPVGEWNATLPVQARVGLTSSKDILEAVARGEGPPQL